MLTKIKTPDDLKDLSSQELQELSFEVRRRIIDVTSQSGGHVAPSLGAVDLAIAMLKVFDPPTDSIVWDVGHQSYAYKILTGRNDDFDTLRQYNGVSGFNKISESEYDAFGVGHSSTSISAALGIAYAKRILEEKGFSIAVIGDGALTGGMAFEALNHGGDSNLNKLLVILNDNEMSISKNVGGLQKYMSNVLVSKSYNRLKRKVWSMTESLPERFKHRFIKGTRKLEESVINMIVPNIIFEDLGYKYIGPVDGHDIPHLIKIFTSIKTHMDGPVFLHLVTKKGKGFPLAEQHPDKYHGVGPFCKQNGIVPKNGNVSWSDVFGNKLCELAEKNDKIVAITAAMASGTGLKEFAEKYPTRFVDVGIAEQHAVTFAGGLASKGLKPFVAIYSTFMQRAVDQVIHDLALQKLPVVLCMDRAGLVGNDGPTHHGVFDLSLFSAIPDLVVMAPSTATELELMLEFANDYQDGPVAIRYPRGTAPRNGVSEPILLGKSVITNQGSKVAIIGIGDGYTIGKDLREQSGNTCTLIDARFAKPLDLELLNSLVAEYETVVTIETNALSGGFGSSVSDHLINTGVKVYSYGIPDRFITHGDTNILMEEIGLTSDQIYNDLKTKGIIPEKIC
ncbi:MAG: 1-deoxy-D-xylulose-5-phosphate synthase [Candidatus Zophobacter franzmannii]|nr:1-deoxy-D-xylulose-5-phosphate synthase [Candidatus Zophobacter franzmannii]